MRIAFAMTVSLESPYGVGRALPWARELARRGHDVHIVALHHDLRPDTPRHFTLDGVHIHYAGQMHVRKVDDTTFYFSLLKLARILMTATAGLTWNLLAVRPDVIHVGKPHPQNSAAGWIVARFLHRTTLLLDYDDLEAESNRTSGAWQMRMLAMLERCVPRLVDGVSVHSTFLAARLAVDIPEAHIFRVPSCLEIKNFADIPAATVAARCSALGLEGKRLIVYVGTMSQANHPVDLLIQAFAQVAPACPDAHLVLVGGGSDLRALQDLAHRIGLAQRCTFVGRRPATEVPVFYRMADFSVDPVHDDDVARARWPLKIVESMSAGTPVLTGDVGDRRAMLGDQAGYLVPPGSADWLALGMRTLLEQRTLLDVLRQGCSTQAERFATERVVPQLAAWYDRQVHATRHGG